MTNKTPHCDSPGCWERVTRPAPKRSDLRTRDPLTDPPYAREEPTAAEIRTAVDARWLDRA